MAEKIREGMTKKGGVNQSPKTSRPQTKPRGHAIPSPKTESRPPNPPPSRA